MLLVTKAFTIIIIFKILNMIVPSREKSNIKNIFCSTLPRYIKGQEYFLLIRSSWWNWPRPCVNPKWQIYVCAVQFDLKI